MKAIIFSMAALLNVLFLMTGCDLDLSDWPDWGGPPGNVAIFDQFNMIQGNSIEGNVLVNDEFYQGPVRIEYCDSFSALGWRIEMAENGDFLYQPPSDFFGRDSFSYYIPSSSFGQTYALVKLTVFNKEDAGIYTDPRDNQKYRWIRLKNEKIWMAQNLNFLVDQSWWYDNDPVKGADYGRLYTWSAALTACPDSWRLPTEEEVEEAFRLYGGWWGAYAALLQGGNSGLDLSDGGHRNPDGSFEGLGIAGYYWASEPGVADETAYHYGFWGVGDGSGDFVRGYTSQSNGYHCRCVLEVK